MNAKSILADANRVISFLVGAGFADDQNFALLRAAGRNSEVTFDNSHLVSAALRDRPYEEIYGELRLGRAYSALLADGGMLQMSYAYERDQLVRHRLAFLPSPDLTPYRDDPELYESDSMFIDILSRQVMVVPIRFDFDTDPAAVQVVNHPVSHFSIGNFQNCRIPVSAPLTPTQFSDFVLRAFYGSAHVAHPIDFPARASFAFETIHPDERQLLHIQVTATR